MSTTHFSWRQTVHEADIAAVRKLTTKVGVFSEEESFVAGELVEDACNRGEAAGYHFIFVEDNNQVIGYTCYGRIPFTDGRFDLYWIAVDPEYQRLKLGTALMQRSEQGVAQLGGKRVYLETSSRTEYAPVRHFYDRHGYKKIIELENFYRDGDNKIMYYKILT